LASAFAGFVAVLAVGGVILFITGRRSSHIKPAKLKAEWRWSQVTFELRQ
jgi:hypothetical protein